MPKTSHHSNQSFAAADKVRAGETATVWPTECCPRSVSPHSICGNRCRERLRSHLGALKTALKVEGVLAEIDPFLLPLPQFMDVTSPCRDAAVMARQAAARELIEPGLTAASGAMAETNLFQIRGDTRRVGRHRSGRVEGNGPRRGRREQSCPAFWLTTPDLVYGAYCPRPRGAQYHYADAVLRRCRGEGYGIVRREGWR